MELEPDHTIEPYLEARLAMLLELNESWADMEKAFAKHGCEIVDVEPSSKQDLSTGEIYPTFALQVHGKENFPWSSLQVKTAHFLNCSEAIEIGEKFEIVCKQIALMLCENTPLDPASAVSLNKIFLFAHEMPFFTRLRVGLGDSDENDHSGFPYEAYFYESVKSTALFAGDTQLVESTGWLEDEWIFDPLTRVTADTRLLRSSFRSFKNGELTDILSYQHFHFSCVE